MTYHYSQCMEIDGSLDSNRVVRNDGAIIEDVAGNTLWTEYQTWLKAGNTVAPLSLSEVQAQHSAYLSSQCAAEIVAGFTSSALGSTYTYPSKPNDQSNLIGAVTASQSPNLPSGWTCNFWCEDSSGTWAYRSHTAAQIQQVLADGLSARESLSTKLGSLNFSINAATSISEVMAVTW